MYFLLSELYFVANIFTITLDPSRTGIMIMKEHKLKPLFSP